MYTSLERRSNYRPLSAQTPYQAAKEEKCGKEQDAPDSIEGEHQAISLTEQGLRLKGKEIETMGDCELFRISVHQVYEVIFFLEVIHLKLFLTEQMQSDVAKSEKQVGLARFPRVVGWNGTMERILPKL